MQTEVFTTLSARELGDIISSAVSQGVSSVLRELSEKTERKPRYYTKAEAKQFLKIGMVTLCQRIKEGTIKVNRIGGRVLIAESELIKVLEGGTAKK